MSTEIDASLVRHIAELSRLTLDDDEIASLSRELSSIVHYFDQLGQLNTQDVSPTAHAIDLQDVLRDDEEAPSFDPDAALQNAPQRQDTFFRVPKVLDTGDGA